MKTKTDTLCPECGASWDELECSLKEGIWSANCYLALIIIRNCKGCMGRFEDEYNRIKGEV